MRSIARCASVIKDDVSVLYIARSSPLALPHISLSLLSFCTLPLHRSPCASPTFRCGGVSVVRVHSSPLPLPHVSLLWLSFHSLRLRRSPMRFAHVSVCFPLCPLAFSFPSFSPLSPPKKLQATCDVLDRFQYPVVSPPPPAFASPLFGVIVPSFAVPLHIR